MKIISFQPEFQTRLENFYRDVYAESGFPLELDGKHSDLRNVPAEYPPDRGGFWLLQFGEKIVGTVALRPLGDDAAELKRLFLRQDAIGNGRGLALTRHALAEAARLGYRRVRLDTTSKSQRALRLFRGLDFVEIERYNDNPDAEFWMEAEIASSSPDQNSRIE